MKVAILGIDGYLGWPLAIHLKKRGHKVYGADNFSRRLRIGRLGCGSLTPIDSIADRHGEDPSFFELFLGQHPKKIELFLARTKPDAIVHLAEQPSAPWSMRSVENATETQVGNVTGTLHLLWAMHKVCPDAHLVKLGSMGEYGTPECDIPEGEIPRECLDSFIYDTLIHQEAIGESNIHRCPMQGLPFPRSAGSFYHLSKVHDTHNIIFACKNWDLRSTDIMQGPVFGVKIDAMDDDERLITRFDYDEMFGTVVNRFCAQAVGGYPLTVYGKGHQTRGHLPLEDSMICTTLAIENPPDHGEYRTFNQFGQTFSVRGLAGMVVEAGKQLGLEVSGNHYENPREEAEHHYYNPCRQKLVDLGYRPTTDLLPKVMKLIMDLMPYGGRINERLIIPETRWDGEHRRSNVIE